MNTPSLFKKLSVHDWSYWAQVAVLGVVIGIGLQVVQAWTPPAGAPPDNGNISGPITASAVPQVKEGSLGINENLTVGQLLQFTNGTTNNCDLKTGNTGIVTCGVDAVGGGGGVSSIIQGTGITISPVGGTGDVTVGANTDVLQSRVSSTACSGANLSIKTINANGTVTCEIDDTGGNVASYTNLPSGAVAGWCFKQASNIVEVKAPGKVVNPGFGQVPYCSCEAGWSIKIVTSENLPGGTNINYTCLKN